MTDSKTKKLTMIGMLCAIAYAVMVVGRVPIVLFLKYDPKDVIITIGGFIFGPFTSFTISFIVSLIRNVYRKRHRLHRLCYEYTLKLQFRLPCRLYI